MPDDGMSQRREWTGVAEKLARPVLTALAERRLKRSMPIEVAPGHDPRERASFAGLEALGRLLAGLAPWMELPADAGDEGRPRAELTDLALRAIDAATDPASPDFLNFSQGRQPLVDAAFLAHALLRAPRHLWDSLEPRVRNNVAAALKRTRVIPPPENNWLCFAAMVEAQLHRTGEAIDAERVDRALVAHQQWYKGDGLYGDGASFHWDYYNSFVIQPMLLDLLEVLGGERQSWAALREPTRARARRYAIILERLVSPEGTYPPIGRSLAYRCGALQLLGQMALRKDLPQSLPPPQVRCAMSAVIAKTMNARETFDKEGWLTTGLAGHQPFLGEGYISTGSLYLCSSGLLPLGLPASDEFWTAPPQDWTAKRLWSGGAAPIDHAM